MQKEKIMLNVFITDLAAYNAGYLIGRWVTLPLDSEALRQTVTSILTEGAAVYGDGEHEEYFITDYEWDDHEFMSIGEYSSVYQLNEQLEPLELKSDYELKAISFLLSEGIVLDMDEAIEKADEVVIYQNQRMEDVAYELLSECYGIDKLPSIISNHIDYESIGRELEMDGRYYEVGNDIYEYCG